MVIVRETDRSEREADLHRGDQRQAMGTGVVTGFAGHAVYMTRRGGPDVLEVRERHVPLPGPGEVVVEIRATGVAYGDQKSREGLKPGMHFPSIPGYDGAGVVVAVGAGVIEPVVGTHVAVWTGGSGGNASHVTVPSWAAVGYPAEMSSETVASMILTYLTAYQLLNRAVPVPEGATILVHPAAGTVGTALLQLGALRGLRMFGTASASKAHLVSQAGAEPINYRTEDYARRIRTDGPEGIDAIFDGIGGNSWRKDLPLLRAGGHLAVYGFTEGVRNGRRNLAGLLRGAIRAPRPSYLTYYLRGVGVTGYRVDETIAAHHDWYAEDMSALIQLLRNGAITPIIHKTFPFREAAEAHRELASGSAGGKILLLPAS